MNHTGSKNHDLRVTSVFIFAIRPRVGSHSWYFQVLTGSDWPSWVFYEQESNLEEPRMTFEIFCILHSSIDSALATLIFGVMIMI